MSFEFTKDNYQVFYYRNSCTLKVPVLDYLKSVSAKEQAKIAIYIGFLKGQKGYLDEPYSRYLGNGLRELRVDFGRNRNRIVYITVEAQKIILLHAFFKKTSKTPEQEIVRALNNLQDYKIHEDIIAYEKTN